MECLHNREYFLIFLQPKKWKTLWLSFSSISILRRCVQYAYTFLSKIWKIILNLPIKEKFITHSIYNIKFSHNPLYLSDDNLSQKQIFLYILHRWKESIDHLWILSLIRIKNINNIFTVYKKKVISHPLQW